MKGKHTLGPWKAHLNVPTAAIPGHIIKAVYDPQSPVASVWVGGGTHGVERQIANAHLIAAAPEMLAKLEEIEKVIIEWPPVHEGGDYLHGWILNSVRDLIAKAKGES